MLTRSFILIFISIALATVVFAQNYVTPMTGADRVRWLVHQNLGPAALAEDVLIGAESTLSNSPKEYDTHWDEFESVSGLPRQTMVSRPRWKLVLAASGVKTPATSAPKAAECQDASGT